MADDIGLPKEAQLHAQRDMRNVQMSRSTETAAIAHAQADLSSMPTASHDMHPPHSRDQTGPPSTSSVLWAAWRAGLKDLQNVVLNAFPPGHVAQHEEQGSIANPTQLEVYQEKHNDSPNFAGDELSYNDRLAEAAHYGLSMQQSQDRGMERGR